MARLNRQTAVASAVAATVAASALVLGSLHGPAQPASGRLFYVSPSGADGNAGTSLAAPYRTISRCTEEARAADSCLVRAGTYRETVTLPYSGTTTQRITLRSYQSERVIIDGADPVTGWAHAAGSVYTASVTLPISGVPAGEMANQVFFDDRMLREGTWPNVPPTDTSPLSMTFSLMQAGTTRTPENTRNPTAIVDAALPITTTDLVGSIVHYWGGASWWASTGVVSAQGLLTGTPAITFTPSGPMDNAASIGAQPGSRYYLCCTPALLDAPGEWAYYPVTHTLALWAPAGDDPATHVVEAKQRRWALDLGDAGNVSIAHLQIMAAGITSTAGAADDVLSGLDVRYPTHYTTLLPPRAGESPHNAGLYDSGVVLAGARMTLQDSTLARSAGSLVSLSGRGNAVVNSLLREGDYGGSNAGLVSVTGPGMRVLHSTLLGTVGRGIMVTPAATDLHLAYTDIARWSLYSVDTGGVYICCDGDQAATLDHNWVHDSAVPVTYTTGAYYPGAGLYSDVGTSVVTMHHNVIWNSGGAGIQDNGSAAHPILSDLLIANNTVDTRTPLAGVQVGATRAVRYANNLYLGPTGAPVYLSGAQVTHDLRITPRTVPAAVVGAPVHDYRLAPLSPAIDRGADVAGITDTDTDGAAGAAPDVGAYERGRPAWAAGCTLAVCQGVDTAIPAAIYGQ